MKNLISFKETDAEKIVFVGDTHGDLDASQKIIENYLKPCNIIVFLGDYVDRGKNSRGNIDYLLAIKKKFPKQIYLLLGNHDAWNKCKCYPADFWENLDEKERKKYEKVFEKFPLVFSCGNIIACHGGLPDLTGIEEINKIQEGDENWRLIIWGDFENVPGERIDTASSEMTGRPTFGRDYFERVMKSLGKEIMVRSHQPNIDEKMFDKMCVTIFTSSAYGRKRVVAIADMKKEINSAEDLEIEEI